MGRPVLGELNSLQECRLKPHFVVVVIAFHLDRDVETYNVRFDLEDYARLVSLKLDSLAYCEHLELPF